MEIKKYEKVEITREEVQEVICDECKKLLDNRKLTGRHRRTKISYFHILTHHSDWGNDSIDSLKEFDLCPECLVKKFNEYLEAIKDCPGTREFDIEERRGYPIPLDKNAF